LNKFLRGISLYLLIAIIVVSIVSTLISPSENRKSLIYTEFKNQIRSGRVDRVEIIGGTEVEGRLEDGTLFKAKIPEGSVGDLLPLLEEKGVSIAAKEAPPPPWWLSLLPNIVMIVVFIGLWIFLLNQMQGGTNRAMSFGKSRAKLHTEEKSKVTFEDVAGLEEAKQELVEVVDFLKHPKKFVDVGAKVPKGILLVGPPGTGKTLLARAVAGEAGVPFFSISGSDFVEMFVGVGASRVRDLFETAKKNRPCIVFIDELDAVGRQRGAGLGGGHDEREQTLNQLLVEMDGFEPNTGIIIMSATNRPDVLDPALLRPGRFDRRVVAEKPDIVGREEILRIHSRNKPLASDVDLKVLAKRTPGFSGADLENLMNEAAILAARSGRKRIGMEFCEEAIDRVLMGPERKRRILSPKDKEVFAAHEAGHAVVARFLEHADPVHKVSIIGRGTAGGYTMTLPVEDKYVTTKSELKDDLAHILGGRAAEELNFDEVSTGAQNDLDRATRLARKMVMEWGMSEKLGPITFGRSQEEQVFLGRDIARDRNYSEEIAAIIDTEVRALVEEGHARARSILLQHADELERVIEALKERETLDGEAFERVVSGAEDAGGDPAPAGDEKDKARIGDGKARDNEKKRNPSGQGLTEPAVGLE